MLIQKAMRMMTRGKMENTSKKKKRKKKKKLNSN